MSDIPLEKTLQRDCYLSADFFARECSRIFHREWFCAGRLSDLPAAGDYVLQEIAGQRVVVTRSKTGALHAFYNVCRHRGAELVSTVGDLFTAGILDWGRFKGAIRCPYHAWTYELDGGLRAAPHLDAPLDDCRHRLGLNVVGIDSWGGFYFLNLDFHRQRDIPSLQQQLGEIPERIKRYPLMDLVTTAQYHYQVEANWKVILENYNECYHCGPVHPELCDLVPVFRLHGGAGLDWDRGIPHRDGADTFTFSGTSTRASFPDLNPDERKNHKGELIYPNLMLSLAREHVAAFRLWPISADRTWIVCEILMHRAETGKADFDATDAGEFWDLVNRQDWDICERVQRGMNSRVFEHGFYGPMEDLSLDIRRYVIERVGAETP